MPQPENEGDNSRRNETRRLVKLYSTEIAAGTSSVLSTLATFPLDSVKTRMQTYQYKGVRDCVRHTYKTEHLRGFFRGEFEAAVPPSPRAFKHRVHCDMRANNAIYGSSGNC